jgi:CHAT domain-containing protein/Tfp pilus assembly protein PilF
MLTNNLRKTFRRRLILVSHQSLICSIVGIALFSESVLAIPNSTEGQIAQQPVSTKPDVTSAAAKKALDEGMRLYKQGDTASLQQAIVKYEEAAKLFQQVGDRPGEAATFYNIGNVYSAFGENKQVRNVGYKQALNSYKRALALSRAVGDRRGQANALIGIGNVYFAFGNNQQALKYYNLALPLSNAVGDKNDKANTLNNIGNLYFALGGNQQALTYYKQALPLFGAVGDKDGEANTLNNIGNVYSALGENQQALEYYKQALPLFGAVGDKDGEANTLNNIGKVYFALGENQQALTYYKQALPLLGAVGDRRGEANTLNNIGKVYFALGENQQALTYYKQALPPPAVREKGQPYRPRPVGDQRVEANTLTGIGNVYLALGDKKQALTYYNQAFFLLRAVGDKDGEANTLNNIAKVERQQGNFAKALTSLNKAIKSVEDFRTTIVSPELRTSYFATKQYIYQFKISLLMELHKQNPSKGYNIQALETNDRSHARSLVELLTESKVDIRAGIEPKLLKEEIDLNKKRDDLETAKQNLANSENSDETIADLNRQIYGLIKKEEELRIKIRIANPRYAALKFPKPLTFPEIQQKVLDNDTLLLTYSLGTDRSYLWLVSKTKIQSYELPKRSVIEAQAKQFYEQQKTKPDPSATAKNPQFGLQISQTLLQPVANELGNKRLLIVPDGALQYIPFAALPLCKDGTCNDSSRLVTNHEIVNAPSISTIDSIRNSKQRKPTKTLAVIADPVFGADDERFKAIGRIAQLSSKENLAQGQLDRSARESGIIKFDRLIGTRIEANSILPLVTPNMQLKKFDFDASREFVTTSPELGKYRYISFATHGILNSKQPELSGLVLSRIDKKGKPQNGFLRLDDIFNLQLSADLVVLSACETGLGQQISGEGSIGLTRGFMYAGSPRVVVSLWKVSDDGTAELMKKFYTNILKKKLTPATALRAAQLEMSKDAKYSDPYYWAGFTLQGEWK